MLTPIVSDVHQSLRSCCLTRRSFKILALWEDHSFKPTSQHRSKPIPTSPLICTLRVCRYLRMKIQWSWWWMVRLWRRVFLKRMDFFSVWFHQGFCLYTFLLRKVATLSQGTYHLLPGGGCLFVIAGCHFFLIPLCMHRKFWSPPWYAQRNSDPPLPMPPPRSREKTSSYWSPLSIPLGKNGPPLWLPKKNLVPPPANRQPPSR